MNGEGSGPPRQVPTLTEVVEWPANPAADPGAEVAAAAFVDDAPPRGEADPSSAALDAADPAAAAAPTAAMTTAPRAGDAAAEALLARRVLAQVQRQVDLMLEYRLREVLTPVLARLADAAVREARSELSQALRELVDRALEQEIARHRNG